MITRHEWIDLSWQHLHEGGPNSVANHGDSGSRYDEVRVPREHVCKIWKEVVLSAPEKPRRGRRPAIDWTRAEGKVFQLMDYHGEFVPGDPEWDCQARLEAEIAQFVSDEFGETAVKSESVIRKHATTSLEKWRKAKAGN